MKQATKIIQISVFLLIAGLSLPSFSIGIDPHEIEVENSSSAFEVQNCRYNSKPFIQVRNGELFISMCNMKEDKVKFIIENGEGKKVYSFKTTDKRISRVYTLEGFDATEITMIIKAKNKDYRYTLKVS